MADAVTSKVLGQSDRLYGLRLTNLSDGTGESAVTKVDVSGLTVGLSASTATCTGVDILSIEYTILTFTSIELYWYATTPDLITILIPGVGFRDYQWCPKGYQIVNGKGLVDPQSSGYTGDLILTTQGAASGAFYDITLWMRKRS